MCRYHFQQSHESDVYFIAFLIIHVVTNKHFVVIRQLWNYDSWDFTWQKIVFLPADNMNSMSFFFFLTFQISEVVNSMKDLIDYSRETGIGPMGKFDIFI